MAEENTKVSMADDLVPRHCEAVFDYGCMPKSGRGGVWRQKPGIFTLCFVPMGSRLYASLLLTGSSMFPCGSYKSFGRCLKSLLRYL